MWIDEALFQTVLSAAERASQSLRLRDGARLNLLRLTDDVLERLDRVFDLGPHRELLRERIASYLKNE
jgi:hypothetical protein